MQRDTLEDVKAVAAQDPERAYSAVVNGMDFKRSGGSELSAPCPFCGEAPPKRHWSVGVTGEKAGLWFCQKCRQGGNVISFAMKVWNKPFKDALHELARLLGLGTADAGNGHPASRKVAPSMTRREIGRHRYEAVRDGIVVGAHHRRDFNEEPFKQVWWEWTGEAVPLTDIPLYNPLDRNLWDAFGEEPVVLTEGEKAADSLHSQGVVALGTMCGAGVTPSDAVLMPLLKRRVTLWADNDDPGREHMAAIAKRLQQLGGKPLEVAWPEAPEKGDAADFDGDLSALLATATEVPRQWHPLSLFVGHEVLRQHTSELEWLWQDRIPLGYMTAIGGDTGIGKSLFLLYITQAAAGAAPWPDGSPPPRERRPVLWFDGEGRQGMVDQRIQKLGMEPVLRFPGPDGLSLLDLTKPEWLEGLRDGIDRYRPSMAVLDPFSGFHKTDGNQAAGINELLVTLTEIARDTQIAIVCVHDRNKQDKRFGSPEMGLGDFRGSGVLVQRAVLVWGIDRPDPEDMAVRVHCLKNNWGAPAGPLGYLFAENEGGLEWTEPPEPHREETPTQRAQAWLSDYLSGGAQFSSVVMDAGKQKSHKGRALLAARNNLRLARWYDDRGREIWGLPEKHIRAIGGYDR